MKFFLVLLGITLSLGTALSLNLRGESLFFIPLYSIALYHLYRLNITEAFFLTFHEKKEKADIGRIRLGPAELDMKNKAEKNEDYFVELFDWRKKLPRVLLSWSIFLWAGYMLFFRMGVPVEAGSVVGAVTALFVMGSVSIGHLLLPLGINLLAVILPLRLAPHYYIFLVPVYGLLVVMNLILIFPSKERFGQKLEDWQKGKIADLLKTFAIFAVTFACAFSLIRGVNLSKKKTKVSQATIDKHIKSTVDRQSALNDMMNMGLMSSPDLVNQYSHLSKRLGNLSESNNPSSDKFDQIKKHERNLDDEFQDRLKNAPAPSLTSALKEQMKSELRSCNPIAVSPEQFDKIQDLLKRLENHQGGSGEDLVKEFRDLKYGKDGFYNEKTEFDEPPANPDQSKAFEEFLKAAEKKKALKESLDKNIEALKKGNDEMLMQENKALKEELDQLDNTSQTQQNVLKNELVRNKALTDQLKNRINDPKILDQLEKLAEENKRIQNEISPHMKADEKTNVAQKIQDQQKAVEAMKKEVIGSIAKKIAQEKKEDEPKPEKESKLNWPKILRFLSVFAAAVFVLWFINRLNKKGVKKARIASEEAKQEIEKDLRALKARKLSPREEVIETYNVLHNGLQNLIFHHETPPSDIVYSELSHTTPELDRPSFNVTEIFTKTFYGEKSVSDDDLKVFRKSMKRIFSFYEIRV